MKAHYVSRGCENEKRQAPVADSDWQNPKSNEIFIDKKGKIKNKNEEIKTGALDAWLFLSRSVGCVGWQGKKIRELSGGLVGFHRTQEREQAYQKTVFLSQDFDEASI